jgi:hypothetical protein
MNPLDPSHDLDGQLTQALRPVDPPPGFAARIMELAAQPAAASAQLEADASGPKARLIPARGAAPRWAVPKKPRAEGPLYSSVRFAPISLFWRSWRLGSLALAAALTACLFTGEQLHRRHQQQLADQQFLTAVRITDQALDQTREQLLRAGIHLTD